MSLPSSPSRFSSRRCHTPSKTKAVDVGNSLGVYDTSSVRDRVRQWQAQGGGVVTAEDIGEEETPQTEQSTGYSENASNVHTPHTPTRSDKGTVNSGTLSRSGRKKARQDDEKNMRSRSGSAPAKRIVSDGHWKRKRTPPKGSISSRVKKESPSARVLADDGIRIKPMLASKAQDKLGMEAPGKSPKRDHTHGDDGIRVYVTPPGSHRSSKLSQGRGTNPLSGHAEEDIVDAEALEGARPVESIERRKRSTPERSLRKASTTSKGEPKKGMSRSQDPDGSPHSNRPPLSESKESARSHRGNILSQVFGDHKKIFAKQAPEEIPTSRVPSVEAWLNETSDPFVEADELPLDFIAPLKPSIKKRRPTSRAEVLEEVEDPNNIWNALDTKEGTRRVMNGSRRRKRIPSSAIYEDNPFPEGFDSDTGLSGSGKGSTAAPKFVDLVSDSPETSPLSLKRRSARKSVSSPVRDRQDSNTFKETTFDVDDGVSGSLSSQIVSSAEPPKCSIPLKPPGLHNKRPPPTTGQHRLSTIASVETFSTRPLTGPTSLLERPERTFKQAPIEEDETACEARDQFDPDSLKRDNSRLTKHADLISILSLPKPSNRSIQSARSIRTNRSRLATATVGDLLRELTTDESKYMRELRTLVDGVIPVLLTCVLSKSDSAVAAGLFRPSAHAHEDPNFTRPIVDMGIALERLKTLHRRIPQDDPAALLTWAHGAQRVYAEYLKAWRMGFQDVVVNLAPAADSSSDGTGSSSVNASGLDEGLPRNEDGDVINGDGERVDVAFLLKRPLVRLKYLQKTLKGINFLKPSPEADLLATKYQKLVDDARQRSNEERARLEDEAASNVDSTRTRDPKTLAPLAGAIVDRTRRVRARDNFNLALQHSSGQRVDCRVELILRDDVSDVAAGGDLLICEMDATGKWLLFPPIEFSCVSARNGDLKGEIVVMIRGLSANGSEWQELFSLLSEDEQAGFEWVQMLGLNPIPPKIMRSQSFLNKHQKRKSITTSALVAPAIPISPTKSRTPSPREVEIPIGEQANETSCSWIDTITEGLSPKSTGLSPRERRGEQHPVLPMTPSKSSNYVDQVNDLRSLPSQAQTREPASAAPTRAPRSFKEALGLSGTSTSVGLKRARANRRSRHGEGLFSSPRSRNGDGLGGEANVAYLDTDKKHQAANRKDNGVQVRSLSPEPSQDLVASKLKHDANQHESNIRSTNQRSRSSVPTMELPYIPKARQNSPPTTPTFELEQEPDWPSSTESVSAQSPTKLTKKQYARSKTEVRTDSSPPLPPDHRSPKPVQLGEITTPVLTKPQIRPRRSSSPLKHEYEPSTASESSSESDTSTVEHNDTISVSDSSDDEELEEGDAPTPLLPLGGLKRLSSTKLPTRTSSQSTPGGSIKPSESASQAPYKSVPAQPAKASKTIASIFSWSDTGAWQSLHPDECSVVITPGLIEAYEMSAAHSKDAPLSSPTPILDPDAFSDLASNVTSQNDVVRGDRPLVALELTPLVPLRRGTALDISIRSPPTANSQITSGNNIMFRSRNPEECEALYALINHSRINNPTFIALQNARASGGSFGADRRGSTSGGGSRHSWFGGWGRSSSYRASSTSTPSIAPSESSIGSMSSAFSALRRFGKGGTTFNISRSTITSREGSRANSVYTSSDNSSGSGTSSPIPPGLVTAGQDAPMGLSNAKIRLYARETASKWRDMGSARLTITRPEKLIIGLDGRPPSSSGYQGVNEKRIIVNGKTKGEVLLDVQLGESCFERVARTGIAISVWEDVIGPNGEVGVVGAIGGVGGGRARVYMIQMKSEAETAYTFSIVGKLRY